MGKLLLIRHAQASYGSRNYDQLSDLGYEQSRMLGRYLVESDTPIDKIYVGQLKRHRQTYDMVAEAYAKQGRVLPEPTILGDLNEHHWPETLRHIMDALIEQDEQVNAWSQIKDEAGNVPKKIKLKIFHHGMDMWANGQLVHLQPEQYQDWLSFREMAKNGIETIQKNDGATRGINIAAFTSGGTISAIMGHVLGMQDEVKIAGLNGLVMNTSMTEFLFTDKQMTLKSFNGVPHLNAKAITYV